MRVVSAQMYKAAASSSTSSLLLLANLFPFHCSPRSSTAALRAVFPSAYTFPGFPLADAQHFAPSLSCLYRSFSLFNFSPSICKSYNFSEETCKKSKCVRKFFICAIGLEVSLRTSYVLKFSVLLFILSFQLFYYVVRFSIEILLLTRSRLYRLTLRCCIIHDFVFLSNTFFSETV